MKKFIILSFIALALTGCDAVYKYVFLPEEKVEYGILPDEAAIKNLNNPNYYITKDGLAVGYDAKDWKIEIRYMSDYQLNNFEFPTESKDGEFSGNPFTYANWIDPVLGFTPKRFTVFKISIYNYTGSKLNFNPELSFVQTDRGDLLTAYAREQKNARNVSIEEYFKIRKGTSGVDEDIFETRMGIARRTMLYYGKPIYKGDSRDGLVVYDPIVESVKKVRLSMDKFIIGYDENNDPSDFIDLVFYFKQIPIDSEKISQSEETIAEEKTDGLKITQIKYVNNLGLYTDEELASFPTIRMNPWDPSPGSLNSMLLQAEKELNIRTNLKQLELKDESVLKSDLMLILGVDAVPMLQEGWDNLIEYIQGGGLVFIDNASFQDAKRFNLDEKPLLQRISASLGGKVEIKQITMDNPLFSSFHVIGTIPPGYEKINHRVDNILNMEGLYLNGKLAVIYSGKSYVMLWGDREYESQKKFGTNLIALVTKNKK
jgi:hypothetical protein